METQSRCASWRGGVRSQQVKPKSNSQQFPRSPRHQIAGTQPALVDLFTQREEFYRAVLDSLGQGVIITDAQSRILYANRKMEELTGHSKNELIGRISYEILAPKRNWPTMQRRLKERLSGKEEVYEHELVKKDGSISWIQVKASPYRNAQGEIIGTVGSITCIDRQKNLENENAYLLSELNNNAQENMLIGQSPAFHKLMEQIDMVAPTCANVLILGESGTGKELVSRAIHEKSDRKERPLVRVNCASIPKELFESEFFGHVRGAFTGAVKDRVGRFELANGGTLFLDEVGEIPIELQSKLLRVLQEGQFERLGEDRTRTVNVRIIAATNRDLQEEAKAGRFRMDLYYRLSVFPMEVPPLRERREDIALLARHFLERASRRAGRAKVEFSDAQLADLEAYDWPGNIRELQNVIERAVILSRGGELRLETGPGMGPPEKEVRSRVAKGSGPAVSLQGLKTQERRLIQEALQKTGGKIYGSDGAAALLGMKPTTLTSRITRWHLK
ncbi:MAG TPA: sigma 54-interacting transcriptional regulator [Candidatus Saccharimonadales bacterium]|nr:sigma 54-interacting transcriptional regulator [Candidatus Saccharimonadales bacterium]